MKFTLEVETGQKVPMLELLVARVYNKDVDNQHAQVGIYSMI
jgi:hypothetical protein